MNKAEEVLRTYIDFEDVNSSEPVTLLPLTIIDAMEEYATQCQEDTKQILLDFIKWSNAVDEYGNKLDKIDVDNFLNKQD